MEIPRMRPKISSYLVTLLLSIIFATLVRGSSTLLIVNATIIERIVVAPPFTVPCDVSIFVADAQANSSDPIACSAHIDAAAVLREPSRKKTFALECTDQSVQMNFTQLRFPLERGIQVTVVFMHDGGESVAGQWGPLKIRDGQTFWVDQTEEYPSVNAAWAFLPPAPGWRMDPAATAPAASTAVSIVEVE